VSSAGKPWGDGVTEKLVWHVVKEFATRIGNDRLAPRDMRRTCARLCRAAGGELEQIQFLLGHVSVQTTERSGLHSANCRRRERQDRNRAGIVSWSDLWQGGRPCAQNGRAHASKPARRVAWWATRWTASAGQVTSETSGRWSDDENLGCAWPANITTGLYPYAISDTLNPPIIGIERRKRWPITYCKLRTRRKHGLPW
jgi:hypothetical protein